MIINGYDLTRYTDIAALDLIELATFEKDKAKQIALMKLADYKLSDISKKAREEHI